MPPKEKYTDPDLRDEIKEEIKAGDKGGKPGQWSARKAQFMASEYKKRGGGYNEPKDATQKHLSEWTEEQWQTKEGSGNAKREDGIEKRYLPKEAWEKMTESEKEETERVKIEGGKEGRQYVENTETAKEARVGASKHGQEDEVDDGEGENEEAEEVKSPKKGKGHARQASASKGKRTEKQEAHDDEQVGQKRNLRSSSTKGAEANSPAPNKKQKINDGSTKQQKSSPSKSKSSSNSEKTTSTTPTKANSHASTSSTSSTKDNKTPSAPPGSTTRLPNKGQTVHWKSGSSYTEGEVVEIVTEEKEVEGVKVKGSEGDPRVVVRSKKSGKVAAHKGEACYFEDA